MTQRKQTTTSLRGDSFPEGEQGYRDNYGDRQLHYELFQLVFDEIHLAYDLLDRPEWLSEALRFLVNSYGPDMRSSCMEASQVLARLLGEELARARLDETNYDNAFLLYDASNEAAVLASALLHKESEHNPDLTPELRVAQSLADQLVRKDFWDTNRAASVPRLLSVFALVALNISILLAIANDDRELVQHNDRNFKHLSGLEIKLSGLEDDGVGFSPTDFSESILPWIDAVIQMKHCLDEIRNCPPTDVRILAIRYSSVSIDLTGGIRDTIQLILDNIVPWRVKNEKERKRLNRRKQEMEIMQKEVEIGRAEAALEDEQQQSADRARLIKAQADRLELENRKLQLETDHLALDILGQIAPDLTPEQRLGYFKRMVEPTHLLATSSLELVSFRALDDKPTAGDAELQ